jgi:hypothetical protein
VRPTIFTTVLIVISAAILLTVGDAHAAKARGYVFEDTNANEIRDDGEPGISDVSVSNGREIVQTDADGRYVLDIDDDTIIFVIKPRGWRTPLDENNLSHFYYIHRPAGSPDFKYAGVAPTGELPDSVDFPLYPQAEPEQFQALLLGDTQPRNQKEVDYLAHDLIEELIGTDAAFGVTLGDIVYDDLSLFDSYNGTIAMVGIPWYNVLGNHDLNFDAPDDHTSSATFERYFGPSYYSFDYGPVHFLVLDDVAWHGKVTDSGAYEGGNYTGGLGPDQLEFIRRDLELTSENQLVVLFMHIPLISEWESEDRAQLYRLIENRRFCLSVAAHYHYHEHVFLAAADGWQGAEPHHHVINVTACGSWWRGSPGESGVPLTTMRDGAPNGYSIITFDGNSYTLDFKAARRPATEQMHIWAPDHVWRRYTGLTEFLVNVYNGSEKSQLEYRIPGVTDWRPMEMVRRHDPFFVDRRNWEALQNMKSGKRLPGVLYSPHIWRALLPAYLEVGHYAIEVRETDMWGRVNTGRRTFRVSEPD